MRKKAEAMVTLKQLRRLLDGQGKCCAYTGDALTPETASLDHIVPLGRNGDHAITNLAIVRLDVNAAKGTMTYDEFLAMCRRVVAHADRSKAVGLNGTVERRDDQTLF
jgi:5-methylcytosine-specific restriction endonuclease McrA